MASDPAPSADKWMNFLTEANLDDDNFAPGVLLPSQPALEQVACSAEGGGGNTEECDKTGSSSRKRSRDECATTADVSCSKANREKMRRDRLNDRFLELSRSLEPGKAPKSDKASILCDAVRVLNQLRAEREALKESNIQLQEQIKELKAEKHELREEKARLKSESEKLQQQVQGSAAAAATPTHATHATHTATPTAAIPVPTMPLHHSPPTAPPTPMAYQPHPHAAAMQAAAAAYAAQMQHCQMALGTPKGAHMGGMPAPMPSPMSAPMPSPMPAGMPGGMPGSMPGSMPAAVSHAVAQPAQFAAGPPMAMWQWMAPTSVDTSQDHMLRPPVA
ncbi:hypothetical protein CLOM_g9626 [Closterium sp. NIES-68]|nr:hypothetical protein CLOM_g9626 [Closterium sp. NIES-68]GJP57754.1 hypothetical protein CLOP_g17319 [Closterium sp. NIES-67]